MPISQERVFEMIQKEAAYAAGWGKGSRKLSKVEGVSDADVHSLPPLNGQPYSLNDFMTFAKKYWEEAELSQANFTPDGGSTRIRILKIISLLVRALQVHGRESDLERLAGISSSKFPVLAGGLSTFKELTSDEGCLIPTKETGSLRNESPSCDPLQKKGRFTNAQ